MTRWCPTFPVEQVTGKATAELFGQVILRRLGARLDHALSHYLMHGYERAVIMNSDGPTLPVAYLRRAFAELTDHADVVLGPSDDGGYYLIGLTRPCPPLFRRIDWGTSEVLEQTLTVARRLGLAVQGPRGV